MTRLETLKTNLRAALGEGIALSEALGEVTLETPADQWAATCLRLRDEAGLRFETCIDLCGVDYLTYGLGKESVDQAVGRKAFPARYAVVLQLLSIEHNWRLRV